VRETLHWRVGSARKPREAASFYGVLAASTLLGAGITLTPLKSDTGFVLERCDKWRRRRARHDRDDVHCFKPQGDGKTHSWWLASLARLGSDCGNGAMCRGDGGTPAGLGRRFETPLSAYIFRSMEQKPLRVPFKGADGS
jgi:hypothetical protein